MATAAVVPYSSRWCLQRYGRYIGRPDSSTVGATDVISDEVKYQSLSEAQDEIITDLSGVYAVALYPTTSPANTPTMTSTDGGQTYVFGYDDYGNPLVPIGRVGIYRSINDIPNWPMTPGSDYIPLGSQAIQFPNNTSYAGPLYFRGVFPAPPMTKAVDPVLFPLSARALIPLRAAINFAMDVHRDMALASTLTSKYAERWVEHCLIWKTQFSSGGAVGSWTGRQLALSGLTNANLSTYPYPT